MIESEKLIMNKMEYNYSMSSLEMFIS